MDLNEVKQAMRTRQTVNSKYYISGCMLRYNEREGKFYYQAELHEKGINSVIIARLEDVKGDEEE